MAKFNIEEEVVSYLQDLIRNPGLGGDLEKVANANAKRMRDLGFEKVWIDEAGNSIGMRRGSKPGPKLVFDAHMDTVEVGDRAAWNHEPFGGEISEGKIWGRGAIDDKGSLAAFTVALAAIPYEDLCGEVYAVGSVGEEPLEGAALDYVLDAVKPDGVIIGEPTDSRLATGHKGRSRVIFSVQGKSCHSSSPEAGDNAIDKAVETIRRVRQIAPVEDVLLGKSVMEPIQIISSPFPSASTVPYACQVVFDRRTVRGETMNTVMELHKKALEGLRDISIDFEEVTVPSFTGIDITAWDFHPAWAIEPDSKWVQLALEGMKAAGLSTETYGAQFCSNGSTSAGERNIPTIMFGPGSVLLAHKVDEYCEVDELIRSVYGYMEITKALGAKVLG
ncbi:MAG: YgeY family selenium metabolism-linked hydrolase [Anaerolineaceae bacterium]|nr:YgeY family selenium metabolism-linked hydrolase [Anaerolineaceae bacterium]